MILKEEEDSSNRESLVEEISPGYIIRKSDINNEDNNVDNNNIKDNNYNNKKKRNGIK